MAEKLWLVEGRVYGLARDEMQAMAEIEAGEIIFDCSQTRNVLSPMRPLRTPSLWCLLLTVPGVCHAQRIGPMEGGSRSAAVDSANPRQTGAHSASDATFRAFPRSLASNGVGLIARQNLLPLLVGSALTLTARGLDDEAQGALANHASGVGDVGDFMGNRFVVTGSVVGLFVTGQLVPEGRFRDVTFDLAQGYVINGVLTAILKRSVGRMRPDGTNSRSFPSGHTSMSFAFATVLGYHMGLKVAIPAGAVATFIGASRIEHNAHYLSDVVAGATLGYIVGRTVTAHVGRGNAAQRALRVSPVLVTGGGGVMVNVQW